MRSRRAVATCACAATLLVFASPSSAQRKDVFGDSLLALVSALEGPIGDERPQIESALDSMARGLAEWDRAIQTLETQISAEAAVAAPDTAAQLRVSLGAVFFERGRFDQALRELEAAGRLNPGLVTAHLLRGLVHDARGDAAAARDSFDAAWTAGPDDPVAAYLALRAAGARPGDAVHPAVPTLIAAHERILTDRQTDRRAPFIQTSLLDDARTERPMFLPAGFRTAFAHLAARRYDDALTELRRLAAEDPLYGDPALRLQPVTRGLAELRMGRTDTALARLEAAAAQAPGSSEVQRVLGNACRIARRPDQALAHLESAIRLDPSNERAHLDLASLLMELGRAPDAERALQGAAADLLDSGRVHWMLARIYSALGRDPDVLQSLDAVYDAGIVTGAGMILSSAGRLRLRSLEFDRAGQAFDRNVAVNPNSPVPHLDLGEYYRSQNEPDLALAEFVAALLIDPVNVQAHTSIGELHIEAGRYAEAVPTLRRAVSLRPDQAGARYALANALLRLGHTEEGERELAHFREAQARQTEAARRAYQITNLSLEARLREDEGRLDEAAALWERVAALEPTAAHHLSLAGALVQLGRLAPAIEHFERAASLGAAPAVYRRIAELYDSLGLHEESERAREIYDRRQAAILRSQGVGR